MPRETDSNAAQADDATHTIDRDVLHEADYGGRRAPDADSETAGGLDEAPLNTNQQSRDEGASSGVVDANPPKP